MRDIQVRVEHLELVQRQLLRPHGKRQVEGCQRPFYARAGVSWCEVVEQVFALVGEAKLYELEQ